MQSNHDEHANEEATAPDSPAFKVYGGMFKDENAVKLPVELIEGDDEANKFLLPQEFEAKHKDDEINQLFKNIKNDGNDTQDEHPVAFLFKEIQLKNKNNNINALEEEIKGVIANPMLQEAYFKHAISAIQDIANNVNVQENLDFLKLLLGPEPARRSITAHPKTTHEERQEYDVYQFSLNLLNFIANSHEAAYVLSAIQKYKKHVEKSYDDFLLSLAKKAGEHMNEIDRLSSREMKVYFRFDEMYKRIEFNEEASNKMLQELKQRDANYLEKKGEQKDEQLVAPIIIKFLELMQTQDKKYLMELHPYKNEMDKLNGVVKEWEDALALCEKERKFVDSVQKMYIRILKKNQGSLIAINYNNSQKNKILQEDYWKNMNCVVEQSGRWLSLRKKISDKADLNLYQLIKAFISILGLTPNDSVMIAEEYVAYIKEDLSKYIKSEKEKIVAESIVAEFTNAIAMEDDEEKASLENEDAKKQLQKFFSEPLDKFEKSFFANKEWLDFAKEDDAIKNKSKEKNLTPLLMLIQKLTEQHHKQFMQLKSPGLPLAQSKKNTIKEENKKKFTHFVEVWRKKQLTAYPNMPSTDQITHRIIQLRDSDMPLADIGEIGTGDTLLHKAASLYNNTQDHRQQARLLKAIEILFIHGANAFAANRANKKAYEFNPTINQSMLDWHYIKYQLQNTDARSQYKQKAITYLAKYCEENYNMFNKSYISYVFKGYWADQKIKLERMRVVWLILQEMESSKYLSSDVKLQQFVAETIGRDWKQGSSSALLTNLEEFRLEGYKPTTLMLQSSQEIVSKHKQLENEELRQKLLVAEKANAEKDRMHAEDKKAIAGLSALNDEKDKMMTEKDNLIAEKDNQIINKEKSIADTKKQMIEKDNILALQGQDLQKSKNENVILRDRLKRLEEEIDDFIKQNGQKNEENNEENNEQSHNQQNYKPKFY